MLKRLYVDNYKCLVNFEFAPQQVQLLLGINGTGKSSVFDVLSLLRDFVLGEGTALDLFPTSAMTRWDGRNRQTFESDVDVNYSTYRYRLEIEHQVSGLPAFVLLESLHFDQRLLFEFKISQVQLYREDFSPGPRFQFDWTRSALGVVGSRQDNSLVNRFWEWLRQLQVTRINPFAMTGVSDREDANPRSDMTNFASWYRHLVQEDPELVSRLIQTLREVWDGFAGLRLEKVGPSARVLKCQLESAGTREEYALEELSEGQRVLLVFYTLVHFARSHPEVLLCLDEPDNFVALAEIQPWLATLSEDAADHGAQILFISHHPEVMNYLTTERTVILKRSEGGPTRIVPFEVDPKTTLTPAEIVARGWENE